MTSINFRGVFNGCKHAVRQFKEQGDGGVIVNTGLTAASPLTVSDYSAAP